MPTLTASLSLPLAPHRPHWRTCLGFAGVYCHNNPLHPSNKMGAHSHRSFSSVSLPHFPVVLSGTTTPIHYCTDPLSEHLPPRTANPDSGAVTAHSCRRGQTTRMSLLTPPADFRAWGRSRRGFGTLARRSDKQCLQLWAQACQRVLLVVLRYDQKVSQRRANNLQASPV